MRGVNNDHIDTGINQGLGALKTLLTHRGCGSNPQTPCASLQASGCATAFSMSLTVIRPTQR